MKEIREHIERAFEILNRVSVKGESVDYLAAARQELRLAYEEAKKDG